MTKVSVVCHSYRGVTNKLVEALVKGIADGGGEVNCKLAGQASIVDLLDSDAFVLASGQPFGTIAGPLKTFLENCWLAPEREQLQGKDFTFVLNGNAEPTDSGAYLGKVGSYFRWNLVAQGITTKAAESDQVLDRVYKLGVTLASQGK